VSIRNACAVVFERNATKECQPERIASSDEDVRTYEFLITAFTDVFERNASEDVSDRNAS
jgi:hypothetical protein